MTSQTTNATTTTATTGAALHETPLWVEQAHGVESVATTLGLLVAG